MQDYTLNFLDFPVEIAEKIFLYMDPVDLTYVGSTCKTLHTLSNDKYIWRRLFQMHPFDDLRQALQLKGTHEMSPNWKLELQDRVRAQRVCEGVGERHTNWLIAIRALLSAVRTALPVTDEHSDSKSANLVWVENLLRETSFLKKVTKSMSPELIQAAAQMKTYLALSLDDPRSEDAMERLSALRTESRCYVYDLRRYGRENNYGPFDRNKEVNWCHAESIMNVISMNILEVDVWEMRPPMGLEATRPYSAPGTAARAQNDWAGVAGKWKRFVCFMDYRDLFAFNYSSLTHEPRNPAFFEEPTFHEATRLIDLELHLVPSPLQGASTSSSGNSRFPDLYFKGVSRGIQGSSATVSGSVTMGSDGVVRWHVATTYDGHTQWRGSSEGIQVGNIASAAGVIGSWTGAGHDTADPVGPCWLWKISSTDPEDDISGF